MSSTDTRRVAGATMADVTTPSPSLSRDLARSQGTDFFAMDDLLTDQERSIRDKVRAFSDDQLTTWPGTTPTWRPSTPMRAPTPCSR
jgi:hypothetical protein